MKHFLFFLILFAVVAFGNVSQKRFDVTATPATSVKTESHDTVSVDIPLQAKTSFLYKSEVWNKIVSIQKELRYRLTTYLTAMKNGESNVISWFFLICFIYGIIHALGPGHGKSVVVGYFLARRGHWWHGVGLGFSITMIHSMSAVILLFVLFLFAQTMIFPTFEVSRGFIEKASYLLVILMGLFLIVFSIVNWIRNRKKEPESFVEVQSSWKELLGIAFVTGIVPCPAVALVVFFCLLQGLFLMGFLGAIAIGLGMAITNILFGLGTIFLRKGIEKGAHKVGALSQNVNVIVSLVGGLLVSLTGLLLFFGSSTLN